MKLYELSQNILNIQELIDNPEIDQSIIEEALNQLEGDFSDKVENIVKLIKCLEADIEQLKKEADRLIERRQSLEKRVEGLKAYTQREMAKIGREKIKTSLFTIYVQKSPPSVDVIDESQIPEQYKIPQEPKLDKKALLKALQEGAVIEGAALKQGKSLRIR